ncbi:MAG: SulP family inorganic anion transporter [Tardiphaga sp.]
MRLWRNDVFAGLVAAVLTISFGLSYSVLIFSGPLTSLLPYGIAMTFISASVAAAIVALGSTFHFAVAGPESSVAAVTSILSVALADRIVAAGMPMLGPVLLTLAASTIATGIVLCGFGLGRIGRAIRYVPYPVIGGFLGATACLMVCGAFQVTIGQRILWADRVTLTSAITYYELAAASAVALTIYVVWHRSRKPLALPVILLVGIVAGHVGFRIAGLSVADAQTMGWTFASPPRASLTLPWAFLTDRYPWEALPALLGDVIGVIFVTVVSALFNTTGIEVAVHRDADIERELTVTGIANIVTGALGGYAACTSISRSMLNLNSGATGRLSGLTVAAAAALMLVVDPALLSYMPKFVLGGLLMYLGLEQLHRWIIDSRKRLSPLDYLSLLAIIVIILKWGFVAGVLIGVIIGCATFALSVSRVSSIKYGFDGSEYRSSLDRSLEEQRTLAAHGREIHGLHLQSYLFFGSANRLYLHVKALLNRHPECRYLVFDFRLVTGIDSSAVHGFAQIRRAAEAHGAMLVLAHLHPSVDRSLRASQFINDGVKVTAELDHALEWCENAVIAQHRDLAEEEGSLRHWFTRILRTPDEADELIRRCQRVEVAAGEIVAHAGDAAVAMHFILDGRLGIMVPAGDGKLTRVRSLGRYTTVGEMGLVSEAADSATIQAETASVLYMLPAAAFEDIKLNHIALSQKLLTYLVSVMAERLAFASRTIAVLRR